MLIYEYGSLRDITSPPTLYDMLQLGKKESICNRPTESGSQVLHVCVSVDNHTYQRMFRISDYRLGQILVIALTVWINATGTQERNAL